MAHFAIPSHTYIGENALQEAVPLLKTYGKRAFIVTGKHVGKSSMMDTLKGVLNEALIASYVYDGITGEPTDPMIVEGVKLFLEKNCDFIIGIGGGSPLDSAKAIAAMSVNAGSIADYMGKEITGNLPPVVAIPTTAGTGSEATKFTIITDPRTDVKMLLKGDVLVPRLSILNMEFTVDMPKSVTACTGLDALTHAIEAYISRQAMPFTDIFAVSAVKRIIKYLPVAYANGYDKEARRQMMLAAYEAGICINNSSVTIVHGMSRPIGAMFHVPHGMSNAMLLDTCLRFVMDGAIERFGELGRVCGEADISDSDEAAAGKLLDCISKLITKCEIPTLKEYGVQRESYFSVIEKMAADAIASGSPGNSRKDVTKEDCMKLYEKVYK